MAKCDKVWSNQRSSEALIRSIQIIESSF
jgi:hypothetical protein